MAGRSVGMFHASYPRERMNNERMNNLANAHHIKRTIRRTNELTDARADAHVDEGSSGRSFHLPSGRTKINATNGWTKQIDQTDGRKRPCDQSAIQSSCGRAPCAQTNLTPRMSLLNKVCRMTTKLKQRRLGPKQPSPSSKAGQYSA